MSHDTNTCQTSSLVTPENQYEWMRDLPDDKKISEVTIPGTHGSATYRGYIKHMHQTQVWDIRTQLNNGIRYLDLQVYECSGKIYIYHFNQYQEVDFSKDVIDVCEFFLVNHPSEFILLMIRTSWDETDIERSISNLCFRERERKERFWFRAGREIPTVKQARGKIVLLRKYRGTEGIPVDDSLNLYYNTSVGTFRCCNEGGWKWIEIKQALMNAQMNEERSKIQCTYVVASGYFAYPYTAARRLNYNLNTFLQQTKDSNRNKNLGCVVLDYPSCEIIQRIFSLNEMRGE